MANNPGLLVTGGSRGIGAAIVRMAVARGLRVAFTYRRGADAADRLCGELNGLGGRVAAICSDAGDWDDARRVLEWANDELGPITLLVNNAGATGALGPFLPRAEKEIRRIFDVNLFGAMAYAQEMIRILVDRGSSGAIVNISSIAATTGAPGEYVHYAASKAALEAFTIGLAREVAIHGVRVNAVAPGTVQTDIHETAGDKNRPARIGRIVPMRRVGEPEEIAHAALWLLSDEASYTVGSILRVSGGL